MTMEQLALRARDTAIELAAKPDEAQTLIELVSQVVRWSFRPGDEFTTDDLWEALQGEHEFGGERRAMGAAIRALLQERKIEPTGRMARSRHSRCHARPKAVWRKVVV